MILAIVLLSIGLIIFLFLFLYYHEEYRMVKKNYSDYQRKIKTDKKRPVLKKKTKGIARFYVKEAYYTNGHESEGMVQVEAQVELVSVFENRAIVKVLTVHDHISSQSAAKWLNRMNQNVYVDDVKWEVDNQNLDVTDNDIIELYKKKNLEIGGLNLKYVGSSSPIELIDKLIV